MEPRVHFGAPNTETATTPDVWIPVAVNISIPLLLIVGGCLSGYGLVQFLKFIALGSAFIVFLPSFLLLIVLGYLARIIDHIYTLMVSLIELLVAMGLWVLGLFKYQPEEVNTSESKRDAKPETDESDTSDENEPFVNPYENKKENSDE